MKLRILVPDDIVFDDQVQSLVAEGEDGHFGLLPRHIDFVSALVPGILCFVRRPDSDREYLAVDRGILVKQGKTVTVSVRNAVGGVSLEELVQTVNSRFLELDDRERAVRSAVARLEAGFLRRVMDLK
jgi:F-type H+-transporting ATPase subunit epsilon